MYPIGSKGLTERFNCRTGNVESFASREGRYARGSKRPTNVFTAGFPDDNDSLKLFVLYNY